MFLALMLLIGPPVQAGPVTADVALSNRQAIEAGSQLPPMGQVQLDQALTVKSGMALDGGTLKNQYTPSPFGPNCTALAGGLGVGYSDAITRVSATRWAVVDPSALANYQVGNAVHCLRYDGYFDAVGQLCSRRTIVAKAGNVITLSAGIDPRCNRAKWYTQGAPIIQDVRAGQLAVSLPSTAQASAFSPGDYVLVTAGPDIANADHGEFRRVTQVLNFSVYLELPTQRAYKSAVLAKVQPVKDVALKNLTLDAPVNAASNTLFARYANNWRLENVTVNGHLGMAACSNATLANCTVSGELGLGSSCHDITLVNCRIARLVMEEGCFAVHASGCTFGPHAVPLQSSLGCERLAFRSCRVTGATVFPVSLEAPDLTVEDMAIDGSVGLLQSWFAGDRLRCRRIRSDTATTFFSGSNLSVVDVQSTQGNLGWIDGVSQSSGTALGVANAVNRQGSWRIVP